MKLLKFLDKSPVQAISDQDGSCKVCFADCFCTAQLINLLAQIILYYPNSTLVVALESGDNVSGRPGAILPDLENIYCSGLFQLIGPNGKPQETVSLCKIVAISISGESYNNSITYRPLPEYPPTGCEANCESAIRGYLPVGSSAQIKAGGQTVANGIVQINEYGMLVLTDKKFNSPAFVSTCKIESIK